MLIILKVSFSEASEQKYDDELMKIKKQNWHCQKYEKHFRLKSYCKSRLPAINRSYEHNSIFQRTRYPSTHIIFLTPYLPYIRENLRKAFSYFHL